MKIEQNAFSKYVLDLLVEQFAPYCEARFSFFKITTPPTWRTKVSESLHTSIALCKCTMLIINVTEEAGISGITKTCQDGGH